MQPVESRHHRVSPCPATVVDPYPSSPDSFENGASARGPRSGCQHTRCRHYRASDTLSWAEWEEEVE